MGLPYDNMDYGEDQIGARNIPELNDVELTNLANGEVLQYNSTSEKWENSLLVDNDTDNLVDLTDTNITTPITNGSSLIYNTSNGKWENTVVLDLNTDNLVDLTDTNISSVANNEILKYNSTSSKWENNNLLINEINDVNITSLQNGEVLKYNSTSGKWENQDNTDTLNELTDVTLTGSSNNQVLKYNGSIWVNNFVNLTELADTNIPSLNNGDILRYNSVSQKWETNTFNIDDLDNVNIISVANNEILKYNSTSGKWENSNRIDTLDELGDVTLTSVTTGDLLRYNGTNFVNTKIALDNDFTNVNFTSLTNGDLIKYNGTNFINFAPTYLDGVGISDNFLIKVVSGVTTQTTFREISALNSTSLQTYIPLGGGISIAGGSIETEIFDTTKQRMHLTTGGIASANGITITSDGRVGIGVVEPGHSLDVAGHIRLKSSGADRLIFNNTTTGDIADVDAIVDGTNGGAWGVRTKVDGGSLTEKMRINNVGNVGIGTNNPTTKLDVNGTARIGNTLEIVNEEGLSTKFNDENSNYIRGDQTYFNHGISVTGSAIIDNNVGINTASPAGRLHVANSLTQYMTYSSIGNLEVHGPESATSGTFVRLGAFYDLPAVYSNNVLYLISDYDNDIIFKHSHYEKMRIKANGNVGIGTNNPTTKLDVNGDIKGDNLFLGTDHTQTSKINMILTDNTRIEIGKSDEFINSPAFPPLNAYGMSIQSNSDGLFVGLETYDGGNNYRPLLKWGDDATDTPFTIQSAIGNHKWEFGTNGTLVVPGNVGIGTNPSYKLHVNNGSFYNDVIGVARKSLIYSLDYDITLKVTDLNNTNEARISVHQNGAIYYLGTFINLSDDRIKSYEEPLTNTIDLMKKMKPKHYKKHPSLILDEDNETPDLTDVPWKYEYGFIAQELESDPVLSHFVTTHPESGIKHVNYIEMIPLLCSSIKELNNTVEKQQETINSLILRLDALENKQ